MPTLRSNGDSTSPIIDAASPSRATRYPSPTKSPAKKKRGTAKGKKASYLRDDRIANHGGRSPSAQRKQFEARANKKSSASRKAPPEADDLSDKKSSASRKAPPEAADLSNGNDSPEVEIIDPPINASNIINLSFSNALSLQMEKAMRKKETEADSLTFSRDQMRDNMFKPLQLMKDYIMKQAKIVDKELAKQQKGNGNHNNNVIAQYLFESIPANAPSHKISKSQMVSDFIGIWKGLRHVIYDSNAAFTPVRMGKIGTYIALMEQHEQLARQVLQERANDENNGKSMKVPRGESKRKYLEDGATLPDKDHRKCPSCGLFNMHEPPLNKVNRKQNKIIKKEWIQTNVQVEQFLNGDISDPPQDEKGKDILAKIPFPTNSLKKIYLICASWSKTHSLDVNGYTCTSCTDRSCKTCKSNCNFVCTYK